jgi:hypothetical protein
MPKMGCVKQETYNHTTQTSSRTSKQLKQNALFGYKLTTQRIIFVMNYRMLSIQWLLLCKYKYSS